MSKLYKSKVWLAHQQDMNRSLKEIAAAAGCTEQTVYNWLLKFGLLEQKRTWKN